MRDYMKRLDRLEVSEPQDTITLGAIMFISADSKEAVSALLLSAGNTDEVWLKRAPLETESAFLARVDNTKAELEANRLPN